MSLSGVEVALERIGRGGYAFYIQASRAGSLRVDGWEQRDRLWHRFEGGRSVCRKYDGSRHVAGLYSSLQDEVPEKAKVCKQCLQGGSDD